MGRVKSQLTVIELNLQRKGIFQPDQDQVLESLAAALIGNEFTQGTYSSQGPYIIKILTELNEIKNDREDEKKDSIDHR